MMVPIRFGQVIRQLAVGHGSGFHAGIGAGLVECDRVEGSEHADVRQDGRIVFSMAVAVRRNVHDQVDVEARAVLADGLGVFRHLAVQFFIGIPFDGFDGIEGTGADAAAAAFAQVFVDVGDVIFIGDGVRTAFLSAATAVLALAFVDFRFARRMLFHLAGTAAAAHADILDGTAEARHFVAFKVSQADEDVSIHNGPADFSFFNVFTILDGHFDFIRTAQAVADDDLTARRDRIIAVEVGTVQVFQGMLTAARIKRIAVRQERAAAQFLDQIGNGLDILRAQRSQTAQFTEMHLDGNEFPFKINLFNASFLAKFLQFL